MKKIFLVLLMLATSPAMATATGYYFGPGFTNAMGTGNNGVQIGTVPQPSSPAVPLSPNWFEYDGPSDSVSNHIEIPGAVFPSASSEFAIELKVYESSSGIQPIYFRAATGGSSFFEIVSDNEGNVLVEQSGFSTDVFMTMTLNAVHDIRVEVTGGASQVFLDGVSKGTGTWNSVSYSTIYIGYDGNGQTNAMVGAGVNAIMIADNHTTTYPPVYPTPTITPTFSISPTQTPTSTITKTFSASPTATPTPTITATPAIGMPTGVHLGALQPSGAMRVFWDVDPAAQSFIITINGVLKYAFPSSAAVVQPDGSYGFSMSGFLPNLPQQQTVLLFALGSTQVPSPPSLPQVFNTATAPFSYAAPLGLNTCDRFITTGLGHIYAVSVPVQSYSIEVCGEGGNLGSWSTSVQASLDGVNFTTILTHNNGSLECSAVGSGGGLYPSIYIRVSMDSLDLGTAKDAEVLVTALP